MADRDQQQLLDDVLAESAPPDFRAALLGETLRHVRRRRRWRQTRSAAGILLVAALAALFAWENQPRTIDAPRPLAKAPILQSYQLVVTQPLPAGTVIATSEFSPVKLVSSTQAVTLITTTHDSFHPVDDEQLLALFGPRPPLLVRTGPDSEELLFAGVGGQKFPR